MEHNDQLDKCRHFLKSHGVAVVATCSLDGDPHAASVNYLTDDTCRIYFIARKHTHKFDNIINNPRVWAVVSDPKHLSSVEVQGIAHRIDDEEHSTSLLRELSRVAQRNHLGPLPIMRMHGSEPHLFVVQPKTITFADFRLTHKHEGEIFEITVGEE